MCKEGEESLCDLKSGGRSYFGWLPHSEEEEYTGEWWIPTLQSCLTFEVCWEEDGLIEYLNDDLDRFPNMVLVYSNLDEIRWVKFWEWIEDLGYRLGFSRNNFIDDLVEEGWNE